MLFKLLIGQRYSTALFWHFNDLDEWKNKRSKLKFSGKSKPHTEQLKGINMQNNMAPC